MFKISDFHNSVSQNPVFSNFVSQNTGFQNPVVYKILFFITKSRYTKFSTGWYKCEAFNHSNLHAKLLPIFV